MDGHEQTEKEPKVWKARLNRQEQFLLMRAKGHSYAGRYCVVNMLEMPPDGKGRAAFSISRRYSKLAVERNRARRLFREVYRRLCGRLPEAWVLFIPRHRMRLAKLDEVLEDASRCMRALLGERFREAGADDGLE